MERLRKFIRSVLPADLTQLIFLAGVVCLVIAPGLRWWPPESSDIVSWFGPELSQQGHEQWWFFLVFALLPIRFASAAGFFVYLRPSQRPVRRIFWLVLSPALIGFNVICGRFLFLHLPRSSVFVHGMSRFFASASWARKELWDLGPGLHCCLLGIIMILAFTIRLSQGLTSLPAALPTQGESSVQEDDAWRRTKNLILFVVTPLFLLPSLVISIPMIFSPFAIHRSLNAGELLYVQFLQDVVSSFSTIGIAMWISGLMGRQAIKRSLRWFHPIYLAVSLAIPVGLGALFSVGRYAYDYIYWGAHNYGHFSPPAFLAYFTAPHLSYVWLVFAAFAEEVIFRAVIQPRLIQRFGIWRGLFLVAIIWSAYHFFSDFHSRMDELNVLFGLGMRLFVCLSLGFVLGWLTLRSGSIWPAVIAHASYNIILYSGFAFQFQGEEIVRLLLWAALAYILYRYWPVQNAEMAESEPDLPSDLMEIGSA